jgi:hypothetical protein
LLTWLIHKSVLVRLGTSPDPQVRAEPARTCGPGCSGHPVVHAGGVPDPAIQDGAVEVPALLADRGQHRAPSIPDLIIAATADLAGLTVLHLHKDFDIIAQITGQPMERLATA